MKLCVAGSVQGVVSVRPKPQSEDTVFENSVPFMKVSEIIQKNPISMRPCRTKPELTAAE